MSAISPPSNRDCSRSSNSGISFGGLSDEKYYLLVILVQIVESMEKFLLRALLACYELYVVYKQHVRFSVPPAKLFGFEVLIA